MPLRLYNTLTKHIEPFIPGDPSHITFYTCGPTVYDDAHIGNFRSFLAADVLRRWIESPLCDVQAEGGARHRGPRRVTHVMNITDVGHMTDDAEGGESGEDRMSVAGRRLLEAKKAGKLPDNVSVDPSNPYQIAEFYANRFVEDARRLGLKVAIESQQDPTLMPRATQKVAGMIQVIRRLIDRGHAYAVGEPGKQTIYFHVPSFAPYGKLSGNTLDQLAEGKGGRISAANQAQKKHPADFLLWKSDPSHVMKWDSPWGTGYPGWHIECTVMSAERLLLPGAPASGVVKQAAGGVGPALLDALVHLTDQTGIIDLHSGGEDNIFPHHECEIAQSCAAFNTHPEKGTFARMWFHPRFLLVDGEKMSKSKGNFYTPRDLFEKGIEPAAIRFEIIKTHYRSNANFTEQGLKDSQRTVDRWRTFLERADQGARDSSVDPEVGRWFALAMSNDLNIAEAIAEVNKWISRTHEPSLNDGMMMRTFDNVLGVLELSRAATAQTEIGVFRDGLAPDPAVLAKLNERAAARAGKNFKRSDEIRDELAKMGYGIKDIAGGKVEVRRA
ncbi:MAG: cysteine--tRNA ligase [Phycisphaerales bacterium]|nr:cysteine--tRNA ligase [Phycisphaerales bacterium]